VAAEWDPDQYRRFATERAQPFWDLAGLIDTGPNDTGPNDTGSTALRRAVDLGCGSGELTVELAARLGVGEMVGIDSSPAMLADRRERPTEQTAGRPVVRFVAGDIAEWTSDGDHDLVFSNAALQWVGDHARVLAGWVAGLAPGGQLAVQLPSNGHRPHHVVARELAETAEFRPLFGPDGPPPDPVATNVLEPERYAEVLYDLGLVDQHVRLVVYPHVLPSTRHVVEWVRGTMLTRFRRVLTPDGYERFVEAYTARLIEVLGDDEPCFFPFRRILLWGRRPDRS
jgi:trans-aconitate 2-methyltransferase